MTMKKSIRILLVLLCLAFVVGIGEMMVHAEEGESLAVEMLESETVSEESSETVKELLKEVLIIMASSETKGEAIDRIIAADISPDATYGEVSDLVDSFVEMSEWWDCQECLIADLSEGLQYGLDTAWLEEYCDTYFPDLPATCEYEDEAVTDVAIDIGEVHEIVENSSSFSEAVIEIAERFGISIEDAEGLVADMKALGDKYLGESELWSIIKNDMSLNPEKYVVIALVILLLVALIAFMLKWIISNMGQLRTLKMNVASLKKSVDGDDSEDGTLSLRSLITAKNGEIKALEEKDAALEQEIIKLREQAIEVTKSAEAVTKVADDVKKNTESALNVAQESALQIAQLLCIAMDKGKMPVVSKEARQIWYENAQAKIKAAASIEEENVDADKVDKTVQTV